MTQEEITVTERNKPLGNASVLVIETNNTKTDSNSEHSLRLHSLIERHTVECITVSRPNSPLNEALWNFCVVLQACIHKQERRGRSHFSSNVTISSHMSKIK